MAFGSVGTASSQVTVEVNLLALSATCKANNSTSAITVNSGTSVTYQVIPAGGSKNDYKYWWNGPAGVTCNTQGLIVEATSGSTFLSSLFGLVKQVLARPPPWSSDTSCTAGPLTNPPTGSLAGFTMNVGANFTNDVSAEDAVANCPAVTVTDGQAPNITAFAPDVTTTNRSVTFTWSAADNVGVTKYELWRECNPDSASWCLKDGNATSPYTYTFAPGDPAGSYQFGLHAIDAAGNCIAESGGHCGGVGSDSLDPRANRTITVCYDTTPPRTATGEVKIGISTNAGGVRNYGVWDDSSKTTPRGDGVLFSRSALFSNSNFPTLTISCAGCQSGGSVSLENNFIKRGLNYVSSCSDYFSSGCTASYNSSALTLKSGVNNNATWTIDLGFL